MASNLLAMASTLEAMRGDNLIAIPKTCPTQSPLIRLVDSGDCTFQLSRRKNLPDLPGSSLSQQCPGAGEGFSRTLSESCTSHRHKHGQPNVSV